jgi:hypothetical protein
MTPDGAALVFLGRPVGPSAEFELYRYVPATAALDCLSCGAGLGAELSTELAGDWLAGGYIQGRVPFRRRRNITADGRAAFFETRAALVTQDVNGVADVYEWRDGGVALLSSGTDRRPSYFLDASADGRDVFILTRARLDPADRDTAADVYDVRVGGGSLLESPSECSGDACQAPASAAPARASAATAAFTGPGNPTARPRPATGKVRAVAATRTVVGRSSAVLRVTVPAKGRLGITGSGLRRVTKTVRTRGSYRVTVALAPAARRTLARRGRVALRTTVRFTPATGAPSSVRLTLTFARKGR